MRELKMKVWVDNSEMIGPFDLSQDPKYWAHQLKDGERLLFTGLTEKNGVEIYEGDIIRIETYNKRYYVNKIVFEQGTFHFGYLPDGMCDYREMEVIGNIYENPELLEESK